MAVVAVAVPFLGAAGNDAAIDGPTAAVARRLALIEQRDYVLGALKDLEFDHRTGKVTDEDYRGLVGPLRRQAAEAIQALDAAMQSPTEE